MAREIEHVWLEMDENSIIIAVHFQEPNTEAITANSNNVVLETDVEKPDTLIGLNISHLNDAPEDRPEKGNPCSIMLKRMMFLTNKRAAYSVLGFDKSGKLYLDLEAEISALQTKYANEGCPIT